jgi:hypothetical protein
VTMLQSVNRISIFSRHRYFSSRHGI